MPRRELLQSTAEPAGAARATSGEGAGAHGPSGTSSPPNILYIIVDELRFPSVFPEGVDTVDQFLSTFMPNVYGLWQRGVKFTEHYTAASACTPARGCLITGLYSQQSWLATTVLAAPDAKTASSPVLNRAYPTYGKLLRQAGYVTPYIGKWHASVPPRSPESLEAYGFQGLVYPDPTGSNLQGTVGDRTHGYLSDADVADLAIGWLQNANPLLAPWCLTVSLVNPHDHEFFWAGTEFRTYNNLYDGQTALTPFKFYSQHAGKLYPPVVPLDKDPLKDPPPLAYKTLPPNWESPERIARHKPSTQTFTQLLSAAVWGGVSADPNQTHFALTPYADAADNPANLGVGLAPFSYWQRSLQSYTQTMTLVDQQIGRVLQAIPREVAENTIIVFTADHGDYAGAHGYVAGKIGSIYEEAYHVPLVVVDPTRRFASEVHAPRHGLTSSVDNLRMLVTIGHNGSTAWMTPDLTQLYGNRADMAAMLKSASAKGRDYVVLATDELAAGYLNFSNAPLHVAGMRTATAKFGIYADWRGGPKAEIDLSTAQYEYYDYSKEGGRLELENEPHSPAARKLREQFLEEVIPKELRAPLPTPLRGPQELSKELYLKFAQALANAKPSSPETYATGLGYDF